MNAAPSATLPASRVQVSTREYEFNHGAKPRGVGCWAFAFGSSKAEPTWLRDANGFSLPMSYSDAKKLARKLAAAQGFDWISVCS